MHLLSATRAQISGKNSLNEEGDELECMASTSNSATNL